MQPSRIALLCLLVLPWTATAQPVTSFSELAQRLDHGDRVIVETATEAPVPATVVGLTRDRLTVRLARDGERTFAAAEVQRVVRRGDSLANGFRWGLAIGAVLGCVAATVFVDGGAASNCPTGAVVLSAPFIGLVVLVDAMHDGTAEVYRASPSAMDRPGGARAAARLSWRW